MKFKLLTIGILVLSFSCHKQDHYKLNLSDENVLKDQLREFIKEIHLKNKTSKFQANVIRWWNTYNNEALFGRVKIIPGNTPLCYIGELNNLKIDTLKVSGDTISGLTYEEFRKCDIPDTTKLVTNRIDLVVNKNGKISDIVNRIDISVACFYVDEDEITSNYNPWAPPTKQELDSLEAHKNDFELINNCK